MPRLSLGLGVQAVSKVKSGAAPSGIPTATTTIVFIHCPSAFVESNFFKTTPNLWGGPGDITLTFTGTRWEIVIDGDTVAFNELASQTVDYIPQTSWNVTTTITVVA